jgi:hypothetical protein
MSTGPWYRTARRYAATGESYAQWASSAASNSIESAA